MLFTEHIHFTTVVVASIAATISGAKQGSRVTSITTLAACKQNLYIKWYSIDRCYRVAPAEAPALQTLPISGYLDQYKMQVKEVLTT